jgi:hypothetical protein
MKAGLPGAGPWRILDDCEAPKHNTLRAHSGRHGREGTRTAQCRCPGAVVLYEKDSKRRSTAKYRPRPKVVDAGSLPPLQMRPPDLSAAPCRTPRGAALVDHWQRSTGAGQQRVGVAVKWMCNRRCPVRAQCDLFAQVNEHPAGSWRGIYGGKDANERRVEAGRRIAAKDASKLYPCWRIAQRLVGNWPCSSANRPPLPEPPRERPSSATRGKLRIGQRAALGYLASEPWGAPPKSDNTWRALVIRGLVERAEGGLRLTEAGLAAVEKLADSDPKG